MSDISPPRRRPGGRSARVGAAVHEAVRALIAERGRDGFTGRDVAERAGVNEATIYRRWGSLDNLVLDVAVAVARLNLEQPLPDTGSLRQDLRLWAARMATELAAPEGLSLIRAAVAARADSAAGSDRARQITDVAAVRAELIQQMLDRARVRGERTPDLSTVLDRLVAPLYLRAIFGYGRPEHDLDDLIDNTLAD
ncbi:TetR/AcrR family transcriptional regulator [Nocardia sp. CDC153]|uniref:TetR/AcrR family transcriptional regulator n=1 Tax=Nocardia sp. CDC153 TaxID=3112167 RepID=UPI002DBFDD67|nr:TetR/AcrR family transcriptional regulator [Nocardia sp. CDC153]MEC3956174.1 TetR/AcrR family transcriptional regulator [Nocardia sp. CDC153]